MSPEPPTTPRTEPDGAILWMKIVPAGGLDSMPVETGELDLRAVNEATFALEP